MRLNLPNTLTLFRIFLVPLLVVVLGTVQVGADVVSFDAATTHKANIIVDADALRAYAASHSGGGQ